MLPDIHHVRQTSINIGGVVQGVGRRPFLYTLARKYNLTAFCLNDSHGILIKVQGIVVDKFFSGNTSFPASLLRIEDIQAQTFANTVIYQDFTIRHGKRCPRLSR
ncbi:MAG: hypothetical protein DCC43_06110 [Candidatus Brocadia sp.]|nr:hypothetical protein [Candidatus Brocadia fulgida]MCE7911493.1 hypothetical protein [Candidatus Brocadia sp. AMX3]MDG5996453.1 hypothetical protein [Candidatus Brocadia sp.]RIK01390.1 MAG: hypothetical protein DCC43_06110 [Candidatus Brocadia sp.]